MLFVLQLSIYAAASALRVTLRQSASLRAKCMTASRMSCTYTFGSSNLSGAETPGRLRIRLVEGPENNHNSYSSPAALTPVKIFHTYNYERYYSYGERTSRADH